MKTRRLIFSVGQTKISIPNPIQLLSKGQLSKTPYLGKSAKIWKRDCSVHLRTERRFCASARFWKQLVSKSKSKNFTRQSERRLVTSALQYYENATCLFCLHSSLSSYCSLKSSLQYCICFLVSPLFKHQSHIRCQKSGRCVMPPIQSSRS
jgi:hypothetical protein